MERMSFEEFKERVVKDIKAYLPEIPVKVIASCCAGVTPESHEAALATMRMCQVQVE